jgi:tripartite-type tricarboxylate transporter receptor subunit TctC
MIVPYVPGGGTDTLARVLAPYIGDAFGQSVVVENRAGAGSTIGTQLVARAAPDGRTIGMIDAAFIANPAIYAALPYDTLRDFRAVVFVATSPFVLCVHPDIKARTVQELVQLAKAQPGKLTFGSAGQGGGTHIAGEQLRIAAGIDIVHVPYKGGGQQLTDLLGGQTTMGFFVPAVAKPHIDGGRLRVLAVTGAERSHLFPDTPALAEVGLAQVDAGGLNGIIVPAGTPDDFVVRLNRAVDQALKSDEVRRRLLDGGFKPVGGSPRDFEDYLKAAIPRMKSIVEAAGIEQQRL